MPTATEPVTLRTRTGLRSTARGGVRRTSTARRATRSAALFGVSVLVGAPLVFVPLVHLLSCVLPLVGLFLAVVLFLQREVIGTVEGPCPACGEAITVQGGTQAADLWVACPRCGEPLRFELQDDSRASPGGSSAG